MSRIDSKTRTADLHFKQGDIVYDTTDMNAMVFVFDSCGPAEEKSRKIPVYGYTLRFMNDTPTSEVTYGTCAFVEDQDSLKLYTEPLEGFFRNLNLISAYLKRKIDLECLINFSQLVLLESHTRELENQENRRS